MILISPNSMIETRVIETADENCGNNSSQCKMYSSGTGTYIAGNGITEVGKSKIFIFSF